MDNKLRFEEALALLEENAALLKSGKLSLEESVETYEKCSEYYGICTEILDGIRQKIMICRPENGTKEDLKGFGGY